MNEIKIKKRRAWLLRTAAVVCSAILLFGIGLVINAYRLTSRQFTPRSRFDASDIQVDVQKIGEALAEFLSVPSYSYEDRSRMDPNEFSRLREILQRRFPEAHRVLDREIVNDLSLLYSWKGRDESLEPILLMSHLDVVPVEKETLDHWKYDPNKATVEVGFVWGRGALDVKCGVIGIMAAVEHLIVDGFVPERTIYLAFGHDEEVGGNDGNAAIAKRFQEQGIRLAFVNDEGGAILDGVIPGVQAPVAFVAVAEKRAVQLKLKIRGEGGHGSMPGQSAILNLAETITRIDEHQMPVRVTEATELLFDFLGPEMPLPQRVVMGNRWLFGGLIARQFTSSPSTNAVVRSTLNVTQVGTQTVANQSASLATGTINARLLPGDTSQQACDHVHFLTQDLRIDGIRAVKCQPEDEPKGDLISNVDCSEFRTFQQTIHEVFPDVIVAAGLTSVSTDSRWYYGVTDKVYRFIPMRLKSEDVARIHGINERIGVENMAEIVRFYAQLIRNAASAKHR